MLSWSSEVQWVPFVLSWPYYTCSASSNLCLARQTQLRQTDFVFEQGAVCTFVTHSHTVNPSLKMLKDMLSFLCQRLFGRTQCQPAGTQLPEEKETEATGTHRELQTGLQGKTTHSFESKEISRSNVIPKKTTVLIMVAPPTDLQQVG